MFLEFNASSCYCPKISLSFQPGFPVSGSLFWSLHRPSSFYQDHGSSFGHAAPSRSPDSLVSGRLVLASLRVEALKASDNVLNLCQDLGIIINYDKWSPFSVSDVHLPKHSYREQDFEGFPVSGTSSEASITDRRISFLQAAKCRLLEESVGLAVLSLSACSRGSPQDEIPPADLRGLWDFLDDSVSVVWASSNTQDLFWWSDVQNLFAGISLEPHLPDLLFWSDTSDLGWWTSSSPVCGP